MTHLVCALTDSCCADQMLKDRFLPKEEEQIAEDFTDDEESEDEAVGET